MKKFLRIALVIIVLGLGFFAYKKYMPTVPQVPTTGDVQTTGIDLTNCISYFDGCNNCSVKDGKPDACTLMYCETPSTPKCNQYADQK